MRTEELTIDRYTHSTLPTSRDIVVVLFRQRWTMLITFGIAVVALAVSGLWVSKYEARMKILVRHQRSDAMVTSSANALSQYTSDHVNEEDLNSEVELLNSDDLLREVVMTTGLSGKSGSPANRKDEVKIAIAVRKLSKDLKIEPLRKTDVISVTYQAHEPQVAVEVLNALAVAYTEKHLAVHRSTGEFKFFDQQMEQYQQGLDRAQARLSDFTRGTGVVSAGLERDSALKEADEFDSTARQAQTTAIETERRIVMLQAQLQSMHPRITTLVRTSDNPMLFQQLKSTLLSLELKRTELLTKYEPNYRFVQEVDQQIAEAKSTISAEENKPIREESSDLDPDYQWVRDELTKAQTELSGLKARAASAASIAKEYHEAARRLDQNGVLQQDLLRSAKTQEDNFLLYERKREEARISDALDQRGILNVAIAEQPIVPALPNRSPLNAAVLALLLAASVSLSTAFVVDFVDPSLRTPDDLASCLRAPLLAALPKGGE